jgi:lipoprotein-releasing system permease protein
MPDLQLPFPYEIAYRHLRAFRSSSRFTVSATAGVIGIGIGVAALIIAVSVMNGYATVVKEQLLGVNAHITVRQAYSEPFFEDGVLSDKIGAVPGVVSASRFVQAEGFLLHQDSDGRLNRSGCVARGVTADGVAMTTILSERVVAGEISLVEVEPGVFSAVIGSQLAQRINAVPGDELHLSTLPRELLLGGLPPLRRYRVAGVFTTGYYEFDSNLVLVPIEALQRDLGWSDMVSGIRLKLEDPFAVDEVSLRLKDVLVDRAGLFTSSWIYEHGNLYVWIRMQTWFSGIALSLIVIVAAFNVISILTMSVIERREEIGVLKAMGTSARQITHIFTAEGIAIGFLGVSLGNAIAFVLCWGQDRFEWVRLRGEVYLINALPVEMSVFDFLIVSIGAMVLCYAFTLLPARDAGKQDPAEAIRAS